MDFLGVCHFLTGKKSRRMPLENPAVSREHMWSTGATFVVDKQLKRSYGRRKWFIRNICVWSTGGWVINVAGRVNLFSIAKCGSMFEKFECWINSRAFRLQVKRLSDYKVFRTGNLSRIFQNPDGWRKSVIRDVYWRQLKYRRSVFVVICHLFSNFHFNNVNCEKKPTSSTSFVIILQI